LFEKTLSDNGGIYKWVQLRWLALALASQVLGLKGQKVRSGRKISKLWSTLSLFTSKAGKPDPDAQPLSQVHGSPGIYQALQEKGISCSQNRVARLMKKHKITAKRKRRFMVTTDSKHNLPVADNTLNQTFQASKANEKWVSDITYVWTSQDWLYLAVVLDWTCQS
jgi:transposase InsO family protein